MRHLPALMADIGWIARKWQCPSGKGRHPHVPYQSVVEALGREPDERPEDTGHAS